MNDIKFEIGQKIQWTPRTFDSWFTGYVLGFKEDPSMKVICNKHCKDKCIYAGKFVTIGETSAMEGGRDTIPCNVKVFQEEEDENR